MLKLIWAFTALNIIALIIFVAAFLLSTPGRKVDTMESGWTLIIALAALIVILLALVPLRFSTSTFTLVVCLFFAVLPAAIAGCIYVSGKLEERKGRESMAEYYFGRSSQLEMAIAIEQNDTGKVRKLLPASSVTQQGKQIGDEPGLNLLQFALRVRGNPMLFPLHDAESHEIICLLIDAGSPLNPALREATTCLSPAMIEVMLDSGADPDYLSNPDQDPLLFRLATTSEQDIEIALLLVKHGADVKAVNHYGQTLLMFAATNAGNSLTWKPVWRLVRYLLENTAIDYLYHRPDGSSFISIMEKINRDAIEAKTVMPEDFLAVSDWISKHKNQIPKTADAGSTNY